MTGGAGYIGSHTCIEWIKAGGDSTLRLDYDLNEDSIVFDLGGHKGDWADQIFTKYGCNILVFEPMNEYAKIIQNRFRGNIKIKVFDFGLHSKDEVILIGKDGAASSRYFSKENMNYAECHLKDAFLFLKENNIVHIDLMKINIEGGEYDLLDHLISVDMVKNIDNIQVQFHDFFPHAEERMVNIESQLSKTHELTYRFKFIWENWKKK